MSNDAIMSGHKQLDGFFKKFECPKTKWKQHASNSEGPDDDTQVVTAEDMSMTAEDSNPEGHNQWTGAEHAAHAAHLTAIAVQNKDRSSSMHSAIAKAHRNAQRTFKKEGNNERMKYHADHASTHEHYAELAASREHNAKFGVKQ